MCVNVNKLDAQINFVSELISSFEFQDNQFGVTKQSWQFSCPHGYTHTYVNHVLHAFATFDHRNMASVWIYPLWPKEYVNPYIPMQTPEED